MGDRTQVSSPGLQKMTPAAFSSARVFLLEPSGIERRPSLITCSKQLQRHSLGASSSRANLSGSLKLRCHPYSDSTMGD